LLIAKSIAIKMMVLMMVLVMVSRKDAKARQGANIFILQF
jgi:hypothetical protein